MLKVLFSEPMIRLKWDKLEEHLGMLQLSGIAMAVICEILGGGGGGGSIPCRNGVMGLFSGIMT